MSNAYKDHLGRPIIAITGMGVITSLGQGVEDNWAALSGGVSGIHQIPRCPTEGLNTRIAGTVDFIDIPANNAVERSYAMARETTLEALAQAGISGDFNGPLFLAAPPVEPEWSARFELAVVSFITMISTESTKPRSVRQSSAFFSKMARRPAS